MAKSSARLDAARKAYREALEAARAQPTPEAWGRLLAAGKELSAAEDPRHRSRRGRKPEPRAAEVAGVEVEPEPEPGVADHREGME